MSLNTSKEEYENIIKEAEEILSKINKDLETVSVKIQSSSVEIIKAISALFGPEYIDSNGSSRITFEMYVRVISMLRDAGKLKLQDYL